METKTKIFDAVEESRKWRETTSRKLDAMKLEQRLNYLRQIGDAYASERADRRARRKLKAPAAA